MRVIILALLLSSCSMVHKTSSIEKKDSTAIKIDKSEQFIKTDSSYNVITKEIEISDLVVVLKDTTTGLVSFKDGNYEIPSNAIKEIRHKKQKSKDHQDTGSVNKDATIINNKNESVTVSEKKVTKDKKSTRIPFMLIIGSVIIILGYLLYKIRK